MFDIESIPKFRFEQTSQGIVIVMGETLSDTDKEMTITSKIAVQSQETLTYRKSIKKKKNISVDQRRDFDSGDDGGKQSKKKEKKHKKVSGGDKIVNTESFKVSGGSRRHEKFLLMFYERTGKTWKRGYLLYEVKTNEDKEDKTDEEASDQVCEWIGNLSKLWKRDLEYLDTGQNDDIKKNDLKKENKKKSRKKVKLSMEDVKIDNPNAVLKFRNTDPLRELQATTSEMVLGGTDLVGMARTSQGKLVLVLPILKSLINGPAKRKIRIGMAGRPPSVLIRLPTRELAKQVFAEFDAYEGSVGLNSCCVYEGFQETKLNRGAGIVVGSLGRIKDHIERHTIATRFLKRDKKTINLVGYDKINASNNVRHIALACNKKAILRLIPYTISLYSSGGSKICFTKSKDQASELSGLLPGARALHGDIQQSQRKITLAGFRKGKFSTFVAPNVTARGLDDVQLIIKCKSPCDEDYIRCSDQIGGDDNTGVAAILYASRKSGVSRIEKEAGKRFEHVSPPQPNDIAKAVGMEDAEKIIQVCDSVVHAFMTAAKEFADEYFGTESDLGEGEKLLKDSFLRQMVKEKDGNRKTQVTGESEIEHFEKDEDLVLDQNKFETLYHHKEKNAGDIIMRQSRVYEDSVKKNNEDRMKIGQGCVEYEKPEIFLKLALEDPCILAHKENESLRILWRTLGLKRDASYFRSYVNTSKVLRILDAKAKNFQLGKVSSKKTSLPSRIGLTKKLVVIYLIPSSKGRKGSQKRSMSKMEETNVDAGSLATPISKKKIVKKDNPEGNEDFMETNLEKLEDRTKTAKTLLAQSKKEKAQKGSMKPAAKMRLDKSVHSDTKKRNSEGGSTEMQIAESLKSKKKNARAVTPSTKESEQILKSHPKRNRIVIEEEKRIQSLRLPKTEHVQVRNK
ncbi:unnamed protein product [Eruca vesicaria subsp. sativa]|uniref:RNA helicase n=1 Tax=Eruca vesicaria subsp. sativa TaxID=29727 RepID=A0ABC8KMD5_ERUVS|nr:unnamed protein product [Eruca vesicaria subsp. sativa]